MSGHGWVNPLPSGAKARCGGPGMCSVCAAEAQGMSITPQVEKLILQVRALKREIAGLVEIAEDFSSGQFRSEGRNIACVHCDNLRRDGAGFYPDNHEPECPVRRVNEWLLDYRIRNKDD